ncbi:MAG TPA: hypothetical protein VGX51_03800 [Solirubrobacteraceae bacterium]|nr:hypothetical protein [Solirubrobacteraceae bacterium]
MEAPQNGRAELGDETSARLIKAETKGGEFLVESESVATKARHAIERQERREVRRTNETQKAGGCPAGASR